MSNEIDAPLGFTDLHAVEKAVLAAANNGTLVAGFAHRMVQELREVNRLEAALRAADAAWPTGTERYQLRAGTVLQHQGLPLTLARDTAVYMVPGNFELAQKCEKFERVSAGLNDSAPFSSSAAGATGTGSLQHES